MLKQTLRMRVVLLDVSLTWSEFLPVSLIDASADTGVQVHVVSQTHHFLIMAFRKFLPLFDRVLVERFTAETVTKGGIMLPEKSQGKVLQATVVAIGPGSLNQKGDVHPVSVKVGEKVLLPEYGGTKVVLDDKDYFLFRDGDILGKYVE
ncbi:10 kDa heat shock protein, mitochondrial [Takifugu rubripes]|uniref:10 kDa heat shock protein, mitochondrial n=1 Tax=Takifugu rubripes TaxID=31033 RepID=A0A3B5K8B8_TAKRU|nr:10 kDa heat shock protein, mitochondrial [Takifugu rubripes]|eukprot:XP_011605755.1 PREDICTED: 10 kDa heat shock protein, mitochondrial [Takifugu rubripes]